MEVTLLDTLQYFIADQQGHQQCLECDICEELNQQEQQKEIEELKKKLT
jgi:hypothetical protein